MHEKHIVLTGGAGFIGSVVLTHLNLRGISMITIIDDLGDDERWKNLVGKQFQTIIHKDKCFEWLSTEPKIDAIIHLGACSSTVEKNANYLLENNTHYSMRLALYAVERDIRFIYASSAATYGDGSQGFSDDLSLLEQYHPLNMYGFSKHLFDLWVLKQGWFDRFVGLKYFNVFGPNEFHKGRMASAILKMVADVQKDHEIRLFKSSEPERFGDGEQVRDFIYVKDVAEMTLQFLEGDASGLFNIGTGRPETWRAMAEGVLCALGGRGIIKYIDMPSDLHGKYQNYTCAEMKKFQKAHFYLPKYSLEEAVIEYVRDYVLPHRYY